MNTGKRLLILDDEVDFGKFVAKVAIELGFDTVVTTSAREFRAAYQSQVPDVIVLDVVMPEEDGIEVMMWLVGQACRARIVIVSGFNPAYTRAVRSLGEARGKLTLSELQKPVKLADLRAALTG